MTQTDMILSAQLRDRKPNANPLRALKLTLLAGCSCLMLLVLASSPQVQKVLASGITEISPRSTEPQTAGLLDTDVPVPAADKTSSAIPKTASEPRVVQTEMPVPAEITGSSWMSALGLPNKGALFGGADTEAQTPVIPLVSAMPRSRIPMRKGGLPASE